MHERRIAYPQSIVYHGTSCQPSDEQKILGRLVVSVLEERPCRYHSGQHLDTSRLPNRSSSFRSQSLISDLILFYFSFTFVYLFASSPSSGWYLLLSLHLTQASELCTFQSPGYDYSTRHARYPASSLKPVVAPLPADRR
jgi:hypothetical protein